MTEINSTNVNNLISNDVSQFMIKMANSTPPKRERSEKQKLNDQRMRDMHLKKKEAAALHFEHIKETIQIIDNMDKIGELLEEAKEIDQLIKNDIINEKEITNDIIENKENINPVKTKSRGRPKKELSLNV